MTAPTETDPSKPAELAVTAKPEGDMPHGYPTETPVAEMTSEQQAAYWKHQSRKHEERASRAPKPEELEELRNAKAELDQRRQAELTETERLNEQLTAAQVELTELRVEKIRNQAARDAELPADLWEFITAADADTAKQQAEKLAQGVKAQGPTGGPNFQQGYQGRGQSASGSLDEGADLYKARHKTKS